MTPEEKQDADRNYGNFHTCASWIAILNKEQTNYILQERGDFVFCHGQGRTINVDMLTPETFKLTTRPL